MPSFASTILKRRPLASICFALAAISASTVTALARCGQQVEVQTGDTLSSIATRCEVTEAKILDLNPKVQGSRDLRPGMELALTPPAGQDTFARAREAGESLLGRLKSYAREAGQAVEGAAEQVTGSVQDFLQRNPDLHQRVRKLGQRLSIPGMEKVEAQVSMSVRRGPPGTSVTLSAIGLPANQPIEIAGGAPGSDYQVLDQSRTSADGTLQVSVQVPENAEARSDFIFVVANSKIELAARSATFDVVEPTDGASRRK